MSDTEQTKTIEIPEGTAVALSRRLSATEFESIDDYVAFALDQLIEELHRQQAGPDDPPETDASDEAPPEASVKSRLESLGYL